MDTHRADTALVEAPSAPPPGLEDPDCARATIPSPPPPGLTTNLPPPLHSPSNALVLAATFDRSGIQKLTRRLLGHATVRGVRDAFELVYAVESHPGSQPVVVVDCCAPSVTPEDIASAVGALRRRPLVVLWGASDPVYRAIRGISSEARSWVRLGPSATDADVAELVHALL